ncbi:redoxin domain-containing protein [Paenactinomyces guangxiensis]|uniref:Redoxin domain-containing protein n=1 Tax=Paenactinomyces guangxiensis TaxID=1490290 RepID=A0A7W1WUU3_9BACL|nr:redoxin domain-containing protein [Paenactinomyces guangxiensis]MBA4496469.1 redoxin domain-containing protein [Paenactinomyces guangxiensis]MBH8593585.1 redoxin domain-containing protein [Paenactinomyces guangxiensis]
MSTPWIIAYIIQWIAILFIMLIVFKLMKLVGQYVMKIEELENSGFTSTSPFVGKPFPDIRQQAVNSDEVVTVNAQIAEPVTLLVMDTACSACKLVMKAMQDKGIHNDQQPHRIIAVINRDTEETINTYSKKLSMMNIPLIISDDIVNLCKSKKTPIPNGFVIEEGIVTKEGSRVIDKLIA